MYIAYGLISYELRKLNNKNFEKNVSFILLLLLLYRESSCIATM